MNEDPSAVPKRLGWTLLAAALVILIYLLWPVSAPPPAANPPELVIDESLLPQERKEAFAIMKRMYQMHQVLFAYASGNDQKFPEGQTANEAIRQIFVKGIADDERLFGFSGLGIPEHQPDGNIGSAATGYAEALAPGECDVSYNPGVNRDTSGPATPILWYQTKAPSGMHYLICMRIGENVQTYESTTGKFPDPTHDDGREVLSPENGVDPARVLLPEVK